MPKVASTVDKKPVVRKVLREPAVRKVVREQLTAASSLSARIDASVAVDLRFQVRHHRLGRAGKYFAVPSGYNVVELSQPPVRTMLLRMQTQSTGVGTQIGSGSLEGEGEPPAAPSG